MMQRGTGGSGGGAALVDNFELASVGDSITNYGNAIVALGAGTTISRDTNGLVTVTKVNHGIQGNSKVSLVNVAPTSLIGVGDGIYVDANTYQIQTTTTGVPLLVTDVTINFSVACLTVMAQSTGRGLPFHLQKAFKGSMKFKGNFGAQSLTSEQLTDAATKAAQAVAPGHFVLIMDGINNIAPKGADTPAQANTARRALIDIITNPAQAGGARVALVCAVKSVGYLLASYAAINTNVQATNALVQPYCNGTSAVWIDTFTTSYDAAGATNVASPGTACGYTWGLVGDGLHPTYGGTQLDSVPVIAALASRVISYDVLPITYNATSPVSWANFTRIVGPFTAAPGWTTATTGFLGGGSGTRPTAPFNWNTGSNVGSPTAVMSVVDPGLSRGQVVRVLHTALAAGDKTRTFFDGNVSGVTLTTLGLSPGDQFRVGVEVTWANYNASNCNLMTLGCTASVFANGVGAMLSTQTEPAVQFNADTGKMYVFTGVMTVPASAIGSTAFTPAFIAGFSAASGSALQTDFGNVCWQKVTGVA